MYLIQQVTNDAKQTRTLILPDGTSLGLTMRFAPMQIGWFIDEITYFITSQNKTFTLQGVRICTSPNLLYQYKNEIPFGLACYSTQNREPSQQNDFSSGASLLYILDASEVERYSELITGG